MPKGFQRRRAALWLSPLVVLCILAGSPDGRADQLDERAEEPRSGPADAATLAKARAAFKLGTALAKQGQWSEALAAYERAQSLHRHAATTYNVGFCLRALGRFTAARAAFERALAQGRARPGELPPQLENDAISFLREIEGKIVRLTLSLRGGSAALSVDGRPLRRRDAGAYVAGVREPGPADSVSSPLLLQLDPGQHTIVVEQEGESEVLTVSYEAGAVDRLTLGAEVASPTPYGPDHRPAAYVSWGMAGAATISGIVAGSIALATRDSLDDRCSPERVCPQDDGAAITRMQRAADIATASFVVAGAGAALGTVLFFTSAHDEVALGIGPSHVTLRSRF